MSEMNKPPISEDIIRRVSRDVLERAKNVTDKRSAKYRFGQKLKREEGVDMKDLMREKPIFYEQKDGAERRVAIDTSLDGFLPPDFFDNPSAWIEKQGSRIKRPDADADMPRGDNIEELWAAPYDVTKVKELLLKKVAPSEGEERISVISKRLEKDGLAEVDLAKKAYQAGIPTPRVLGEIVDMGNNYVWFEKIDGIDLREALIKLDSGSRFLGDRIFSCLYENQVFGELNDPKQRDSRWVFDLLSSEQKARILDLWRKARKWLIAQEVFIAHRFVRDSAADYMKSLSSFFGFIKVEDVEDAFKLFGYENRQQFLDGLHTETKRSEGSKGQEHTKFPTDLEFHHIKALTNRATSKVEEFRKQADDYLEQCLFGFGIEEEIERIKKLCEKNGLMHKDFADRNFMVEWDWARDRPLVTGDHKSQLFVIDWEPNPSSPRKPRKRTTADKSA